jgi:hypothetical protein
MQSLAFKYLPAVYVGGFAELAIKCSLVLYLQFVFETERPEDSFGRE